MEWQDLVSGGGQCSRRPIISLFGGLDRTTRSLVTTKKVLTLEVDNASLSLMPTAILTDTGSLLLQHVSGSNSVGAAPGPTVATFRMLATTDECDKQLRPAVIYARP